MTESLALPLDAAATDVSRRPTLVLSGGGVKFATHVGVMQEMSHWTTPAGEPWLDYFGALVGTSAGWSGLDGVIAARDHLFFPEQLKRGLTPHRVTRVYLWGTSDPNIWFDIAGTLERKITAISSHTSQVADPIRLAERMRASAASNGRVWGLEAAEAFRSIELA